MKRRDWKDENFAEAIKDAHLPAQRKAFRNGLPYAVLLDGKVTLVFSDKHMEIATRERLEELRLARI